MKQGLAAVLTTSQPKPGYCEMTLAAPWIASASRPGQFVHIRPTDGYHPLLRRPISICDSDGVQEITILFRVEGEGTRLIAEKEPGDGLDVLGPMGNGFDLEVPEGEEAILVGGGIGIPPICYLTKTLAAKGREVAVFLGVRGREHLIGADRFESMGREIWVTSEDGSVGSPGFVTEPVAARLDKAPGSPVRLYACGPTPMLKALAELARKRSLGFAELSLEERMSCAVGACMGCVVKTVRGYERVCRDGPVFRYQDLAW